jgi:hypothetical protein
MFYREILAISFELHTKHNYTLWVERRIVRGYTGGTYSDHWNLER